MGKITIICILLLVMGLTAFAQAPPEEVKLKIGLRAGLAIAANRVSFESDTLTATANGAGGRMLFGPMFDIPIGNNHNYYLSTGLIYASKRVGISISDKETGAVQEEAYSIQYLQVPALLKLYTNEVSLDTKVYFQVGTALELNINDKPKKESGRFIEDFKPIDFSILMGAGLELRAGLNTSVFAGFSYSRGLINAISDQIPTDNKLVVKNDLFSIDFGVKF